MKNTIITITITINGFQKNIYQTIGLGKRKPVIEKCLNEGDVRLESQRRDFWKLQQFNIQRRRIVNYCLLHVHQK